jgi:hypothetical protein
LNLQQFDKKSVFLHGELDEETYMELAPGYGEQTAANTVCKLKTALYGLKQSPWAWVGRFTKVKVGLGLKKKPKETVCYLSNTLSQGSICVTGLLITL